MLFGASSALGAVLGVLALLGATAVLVWRKPAWSAVTLVALVPINRFLILLVFHFGHSGSLTVLAQAWKDLLIGLLFLRAIDEVDPAVDRPKLHYVDLLVGAYLAISVLYLFYPGSLGQVSFTDRLLGFRADSYFMLAYFVGRWLVFERRHIRWFLLSLLPGTALVSIIAAAQFAKPDWFNRFFNKLGFSAFINTQSALGGDVDVIREPRHRRREPAPGRVRCCSATLRWPSTRCRGRGRGIDLPHRAAHGHPLGLGRGRWCSASARSASRSRGVR